MDRRQFLAAASAAAWTLRANPLGLPIGSQTYPHRQRIKDGDFAGLCKDMAALGIRNVELCSPGYGEFAILADANVTKPAHLKELEEAARSRGVEPLVRGVAKRGRPRLLADVAVDEPEDQLAGPHGALEGCGTRMD